MINVTEIANWKTTSPCLNSLPDTPLPFRTLKYFRWFERGQYKSGIKTRQETGNKNNQQEQRKK